jgi:DNA-binding NtrC family response regulator
VLIEKAIQHTMPAKILILEDEMVVRLLLNEILTPAGYSVTEADSLRALQACLEQEQPGPDVLLMDLHLADGDGMSALPEVKRRWPATRVVILTGDGTVEVAERAYKLDDLFLLSKPIDPDMLTTVIELALSDKPGKM